LTSNKAKPSCEILCGKRALGQREPQDQSLLKTWVLRCCVTAGRLLPLRAATRERDAQRGEASGAVETSGRLWEGAARVGRA
jgi:hypothetical protein